jgi:GWxTD domain-containing protein
MKRIILIFLIVLLLFSLSFEAKKFQNEREREYFEIVYPIMTKLERKVYFNLPFSERKEFWHSFWDIRGGEQASREYFSRVAFANRYFRGEGVPGWKTDRGYVVRLLGIPNDIEFYDNTTASEDPRTGELFTSDPFWSPFHGRRVRYYIFYYYQIAGYQVLTLYFVEDYSSLAPYTSRFTNTFRLWKDSVSMISAIAKAIQEGLIRWSPREFVEYRKLDMKIKRERDRVVWIVKFKFKDFTFRVIVEEGETKLLLLLSSEYYIFRMRDGKRLYATAKEYRVELPDDEKIIKKDKMIQTLYVKGLFKGKKYLFLTKAVNLIDGRKYFAQKEFKR